MTSVLPADKSETFDYRSPGFGADARALARATGRSFALCRQELFIAEGDMAMAYQVLTSGPGTEPAQPTLH